MQAADEADNGRHTVRLAIGLLPDVTGLRAIL